MAKHLVLENSGNGGPFGGVELEAGVAGGDEGPWQGLPGIVEPAAAVEHTRSHHGSFDTSAVPDKPTCATAL